AAQDEVQTLKAALAKMEEEKKLVEKQLHNNKQEAIQIEEKLGQQLEKRIEEKFQKAANGLLENNKKEIEQMSFRMDELRKQLNNAMNSKMSLIQCTNAEINRLKFNVFFSFISFIQIKLKILIELVFVCVAVLSTRCFKVKNNKLMDREKSCCITNCLIFGGTFFSPMFVLMWNFQNFFVYFFL
ncbi:hypothetical protein RFI_06688, partial [Reticulomyxa filosa]